MEIQIQSSEASKSLLEGVGCRKISSISSGRPPDEFLGEISLPQGGPEAEPLRLILALLLALGVENVKI